ncbi:MAG TPA: hypothetical protein VH682_15000 [Gemmataceae bacterium]|jgi:hypothetical protein
MDVTDIHATVLHQLGVDPRRLEVADHKRLEIDFGHPVLAEAGRYNTLVASLFFVG